jgi:hypothetical protein
MMPTIIMVTMKAYCADTDANPVSGKSGDAQIDPKLTFANGRFAEMISLDPAASASRSNTHTNFVQ